MLTLAIDISSRLFACLCTTCEDKMSLGAVELMDDQRSILNFVAASLCNLCIGSVSFYCNALHSFVRGECWNHSVNANVTMTQVLR